MKGHLLLYFLQLGLAKIPCKFNNSFVIYLLCVIVVNGIPIDKSEKNYDTATNNNENEIEQNKEVTQIQQNSSRTSKALAHSYFEYLSQPELPVPFLDSEYLSPVEDTSNDVLSRGTFSPHRPNSPIYYIRLPPTPYMYVTGLGYVSHPPALHTPFHHPSVPAPSPSFINLPINFVANGKPSNIYQWSEGYQPAPSPPQRPVPIPVIPPTPKPTTYLKPDSTIHKLPGKYQFNGKPTDILILRDSYNSLYSDALQNFYP